MQSKDTPAQPQAFSFNAPLQNDVSPKGYQSFQCSTDVESLQRTKTNKHWLHEYSCSACTGFHGLSTRATLTTPPLSWFSTDTFSNVNSLCWMLGTKIKKYTGMSYLISLNPMLFKNIAHVGSFHFHFHFWIWRIWKIWKSGIYTRPG